MRLTLQLLVPSSGQQQQGFRASMATDSTDVVISRSPRSRKVLPTVWMVYNKVFMAWIQTSQMLLPGLLGPALQPLFPAVTTTLPALAGSESASVGGLAGKTCAAKVPPAALLHTHARLLGMAVQQRPKQQGEIQVTLGFLHSRACCFSRGCVLQLLGAVHT